MEEQRWERVAEDSPERCQGVIPTKGQCFNRKMENSNFCPAHGGNRANATAKKESLRMYQIERYQQRLDTLADHGKLKSLTEEIAILRMILESKLKSCTDDHELMLRSQPISDLVVKIEKLVTSCNRLDLQMGNMLDQTQAIQWMGSIIDVISQYISDPDDLNAIADEIMASYERSKKGQV